MYVHDPSESYASDAAILAFEMKTCHTKHMWQKHKFYCGPQVQYFAYMHIAALPNCVSSLLTTFWLFQAKFFLLCQAFFSYAAHLFPLPSILLLCWALLSSSENFSATLSTSRIISFLRWEVFRLFQAFFSYAEHFFCSAKHFSDMLSTFAALLCIFLLCKVFFLLCRVFFCSDVYYTA